MADTMTVPRMQFYAIEIARNRSGLNDWIYERAQAEKEKEKAASKAASEGPDPSTLA